MLLVPAAAPSAPEGHRSRTLASLAAAALALAAPLAARGHGVELDVLRSDAGIAVRARVHGTEPLAGAAYAVLSPSDPGRAHDEGTTDRHGWLVFVPDAPGTWTVRIVDASGHGKVQELEVRPEEVVRVASAAVGAAAGRATGAPPATPAVARRGAAESLAKETSIYRVVGGFSVIALGFVVLFIVMLRRRSGAGR